ncbi:hypothetical protein ATHL_01980 [Anaerolinea thermolimosa]|uniref:hypothetical protein n=1 Tax=Anaerolinea thermolimosa TaxID=229919 RepID=UPI000785EBFA|nr:hypothetical protein [Anaerolinea thermolimosa]GAP07112.1 hypothetical protein ATHL_01980 [Anaerolinea thermolimosa]
MAIQPKTIKKRAGSAHRVKSPRERTLQAAIITGLCAILAVVVGFFLDLFYSRPKPILILTPTQAQASTSLPQPDGMLHTDTPPWLPANSLTQSSTRPALKTPSLPASHPIRILQQFQGPGSSAEGIAWDGETLWISEPTTIFNLNENGKILSARPAPEVTPGGMTWDGAHLWLYTTNYSFMYELDTGGPTIRSLRSIKAPTIVIGGSITHDLAWDGEHFWYANQYNLYEFSTTGEVIQNLAFPQNITGLDWDGSHLWLAFSHPMQEDSFQVIDPSGETLGTFEAPVKNITGMTWGKGTSLWVIAHEDPGFVTQIYELDTTAALRMIPRPIDRAWEARLISAERRETLPVFSASGQPGRLKAPDNGLVFYIVQVEIYNPHPGAVMDPTALELVDDQNRSFSPVGIQDPLSGNYYWGNSGQTCNVLVV